MMRWPAIFDQQEAGIVFLSFWFSQSCEIFVWINKSVTYINYHGKKNDYFKKLSKYKWTPQMHLKQLPFHANIYILY